jgi:diguanylate cyclase (GGDEF)-like protein
MERDSKGRDGTPAALWTVAGLLAVVVLGAFDYAVDARFSFLLLYLGSLLIVADRAGRRAGALVAVAGATAWSLGQTGGAAPPPAMLFHAWNSLTVLVLLLVINYLFARWRDAVAQEYAHSWTDPVSGVGNTRYFLRMVESEIGRARRHGRPFAIAHIDVDQLQGVNDRVGRLAGDTLLGLLGRTLGRGIRQSDAVARLGGDEFALLLSETDAEGAEAAVRRLLTTLAGIFEHDGWSVTLTIGVMAFATPPASAEEAVRLAAQQMWAAKKDGRGSLKVATWQAAPTAPGAAP